MSPGDRIGLVAVILAVPWTILAGALFWNPHRLEGSSPYARLAVYTIPILLTGIAIGWCAWG